MDGKKLVTVEAVGHIEWTGASTAPGSDYRYNDRLAVARVRDDEGSRYIVNGLQCFRNGTTISDDILGLRGEIEVSHCSAISFNCPTMFGKRGL